MIQKGARVLFISPRTFDYEKEIKAELELAGCQVDWHDDRPASTPLVKALIRFRPELVATMCDRYFDRIIHDARAIAYDAVFVIKGEAISAERLRMLRESQPTARFLYYSWDSLKNFKNGEVKLSYFDKAYSFDRLDTVNIPHVRHLPLFYISVYEAMAARQAEKNANDIGMLFLGTVHSDRYAVVRRIVATARRAGMTLPVYTHFYYQSKWVMAVRKLFDRDFRAIPWKDVQWHSLNKQQILDLFSRSEIVLDIHHPGQTGLTMRTIECLGAGKKMITTNADVVSYDFYRPENILVVDRQTTDLPADFLRSAYVSLPDDMYCRYSLRSWLAEIFA